MPDADGNSRGGAIAYLAQKRGGIERRRHRTTATEVPERERESGARRREVKIIGCFAENVWCTPTSCPRRPRRATASQGL
eukprot:scaffold54853_cov58-Phaeocystis_antarctica.AAC.1